MNPRAVKAADAKDLQIVLVEISRGSYVAVRHRHIESKWIKASHRSGFDCCCPRDS